MNERIKNLLPNDRYIVQMHNSYSEDYVLVLTHLYQPLIGLKAFSLYLTLLNDIKFLDEPTTHHTIMNMTNMDLDQFYQSRIKLEAIGLLKTYVEENDVRTYYYVLYPPFSSKRFFEDSMFSILLEHHVGKVHFNRLKQKLLPKTNYPANLQEKTKAFGEVFSTVSPKQLDIPITSIDNHIEIPKTEEPDIDFEWLEQALVRNEINPSTILTQSNKSFIGNLVKIYHVDNLTLEKAVLWSINEQHQLLTDELHEACKDFYAKQFKSPSPKLVVQNEVKHKNTTVDTKQPLSKEDKLIAHFERITHREILEDFSQSGQASEQEIKMLTNIMLKHGLSQSVMNVLVHYVLQKSDMKLTRNYVEKIATHWARKNVKTVKQAMELAKSESRLYQSWGSKRQPKKKEVLPDWFKQYEEKEQIKSTNTENNRDILKEKEELERALRSATSKL